MEKKIRIIALLLFSMDNRIEWAEKENGVLFTIFSENIPTLSTKQEFYFDTQPGFLLQHKYTADIISKHAKAANILRGYKQFEHRVYPSSRLVTPQNGKGKALKRPTLFDITIHDFKLTNIDQQQNDSP